MFKSTGAQKVKVPVVQTHSLLSPDSITQEYMPSGLGTSELEDAEDLTHTFNVRICQLWGLCCGPGCKESG
eukprot:1156871-Pelagomonas_calceolata.AAC.3